MDRNKFTVGNAVIFTPMIKKVFKQYGIVKCLGFLIKRNPKRAKVNVVIGSIIGVWSVPYYHLFLADKEERILLTVHKLKGSE